VEEARVAVFQNIFQEKSGRYFDIFVLPCPALFPVQSFLVGPDRKLCCTSAQACEFLNLCQ